MYLLCFLSTVAFAAFTALGASLPSPKYDGQYMGVDFTPKYLIGVYPSRSNEGPLSSQQLADLAFLAGRELRARVLKDAHLLAEGRPWTVSVWQDEDFSIYIASSEGGYSQHAEVNIIHATGGRIKGGKVISYSWEGNNRGLRASCPSCKKEIENHFASDIYTLGMTPRVPSIPYGWVAQWNANAGTFLYRSEFDCNYTKSEVPLKSSLRDGWAAAYDEELDAYYFYKTSNPQVVTWNVPSRKPPSPHGGGGTVRRRSKKYC